MPSLVYALCALTSVVCATLLVRSYRQQRERLLLWSALCFCGLAINNLLLFVDLVLVPATDLAIYRNFAAAGALALLLVGLIWDAA